MRGEGTRDRSWLELAPDATRAAKAELGRMGIPWLWNRCCQAVYTWMGHVARPTEDKSAAEVIRWRCPMWWRTCQELLAPMAGAAQAPMGTRGPEDSVASTCGPLWPGVAQGRRAWMTGKQAFVTAPTRQWKLRQRCPFKGRRR